MTRKEEFLPTIARLHRSVTKSFGKGLSRIGMTHGLAAVLLHLEMVGEGCSQGELAKSMEIEQPTLVNLVRKLEVLELIQRERFGSDGRKRALFFTSAGRLTHQKIVGIYEKTCHDLFGSIDAYELEHVSQLLMKIHSNQV